MRTWSRPLCLTVLVVCSCGDDDKPKRDGFDAATAVVDAGIDAGDAQIATKKGPPPEVLRASKEWPTANRDYAATRATFDSTITKANIAKLTQAWSFELPTGGFFGAATAPAVVLDGVIYYVDMTSNVYAIDKNTGVPRWTKKYDATASGPNGVAVGYGKVFVPSSDKTFVALDIVTGQELWTAPIEVAKNAGIGIAPVVYDGLVYLSTVPVTATAAYLGGVNGTLYALDEATGKVVWSFATVQDETLWGHPDINSGGGAWYPPTIDVEKDVMYWGIGNPAPYPGTVEYPNGSSHPGDNLYTNSVLALGAQDGKYRWHYQERPHDFSDLDFQNPPVLATVNVAGEPRRLAIGSGKTGTVVAVDRDTNGTRVWRTLVGKHENDQLAGYPADAGAIVFPGDLGGVETPIAYADGTVYVSLLNMGRQFFPDVSGALDEKGTGELLALDAATGIVKWKKELPVIALGSATVVNDLVLTSTAAGILYAFDRATGEQVWMHQAPSGINAPPSVVGDMLIVPLAGGIAGPLAAGGILALKLP
ncbi:MAG: Quinoprotein ethanol dehydrogenase [Pseudomonadota bacterium]